MYRHPRFTFIKIITIIIQLGGGVFFSFLSSAIFNVSDVSLWLASALEIYFWRTKERLFKMIICTERLVYNPC